MPFVYSTATNSTDFAIYKANRKDLDVIERVITIKGGANLPHPKNCEVFEGYENRVSDEDLKLLESNYHFNEMVKNGHYKIVKNKVNIDKIVKEMKLKDGSAPFTPSDAAFQKHARVGEEPLNDSNHF